MDSAYLTENEVTTINFSSFLMEGTASGTFEGRVYMLSSEAEHFAIFDSFVLANSKLMPWAIPERFSDSGLM